MTDEQIQALLDLGGDPVACQAWRDRHLHNKEDNSLHGNPAVKFQDRVIQENED